MVLISKELRQLINENQNAGNGVLRPSKNLALAYLKKRAVNVIFMVIVLMLLVTTSLFTDFGLNVGEAIYQKLSSLLGF